MSKFHIPLNGSNHISKERQKAFEEALNDKHVVKSADVSNNGAKTNLSPQNESDTPVARNSNNRGNGPDISADLTKSIEISLNQSFAHQNRTMDIHQKYLDQQGDYAEIIKEVLNQQGKILDTGNPESKKEIIDSLNRSLDNFHQMREKGMEVHQQFLTQQADFSQSFVRVLEKQHGLANNEGITRIQDVIITEKSSRGGLVIDQVDVAESEFEEAPVVPNSDVLPSTDQSPNPGISPQILADALLRIVGEKTGYPPEMLELEMDLEADLGIDSIKRVEIMGALEEEFPTLPPADTEILSQTRTLEEIVDYLKSEAGQTSLPAPDVMKEDSVPAVAEVQEVKMEAEPTQEGIPSISVTGEQSVEELTSVLLEIVADKTGYPAEMLELEMDLEADLGIDSIKRVEILGAMEERVPGLPPVEAEILAELRTLAEIVSMMSSTQNPPLNQVNEGSETKKKANQPPLASTPVKLTSLPKADFLEFEISPENPVILTDEGTEFTLQLADALNQEGWKVILWSYSGLKKSRNTAVNPKIAQVEIEDPSPDTLGEQLKTLRDQYGAFSGFIHLHPNIGESTVDVELERDMVKMVFFLAGALKDDLTSNVGAERPIFMTITRINGKLGLGPVKDFQEGSGLTGVVKTLSWEWPEVFTRSIDLDPTMSVEVQVERVIQEIHDPDRGLVEVGIAPDSRYTIEREGVGIS